MAVYDLEEQEQIETLKAWWRQHGNRLVNLLLVILVLLLGFMGWRYFESQKSAEASVAFGALQQALMVQDSAQINAAAGELREKFGGTAYAALGTLLSAKYSMEAGDAKTAQVQLAWVVEHSKDEMRDLARLRLAGVMLDEKAFDEALKQLDNKPAPAFAAAYAELRGDVLMTQGKHQEAREAYQAAMDGQGKQAAMDNRILGLKLDALGEAN